MVALLFFVYVVAFIFIDFWVFGGIKYSGVCKWLASFVPYRIGENDKLSRKGNLND